jgi:hypothetical protein
VGNVNRRRGLFKQISLWIIRLYVIVECYMRLGEGMLAVVADSVIIAHDSHRHNRTIAKKAIISLYIGVNRLNFC